MINSTVSKTAPSHSDFPAFPGKTRAPVTASSRCSIHGSITLPALFLDEFDIRNGREQLPHFAFFSMRRSVRRALFGVRGDVPRSSKRDPP